MSAVYALYRDPDAAQRAVNGLYAAGVAEAEVIVITGQGNIPRSVEAVKAGAFDFLEKPVDLATLTRAVKQSLEAARTVQRPAERPIVGDSPALPSGGLGPVLVR